IFGMLVALRGSTLLVNASFTVGGGTLLAYGRSGDSFGEPRLVVAPGGNAKFNQPLMLDSTGTVAVWGGFEGDAGTAAYILRLDESGWNSEQKVAPTDSVAAPDGAAPTAAFDGTTFVVGRTNVLIDGVAKGRAFVAELPPPDRDHDGLDDECELA